METGKVSNEARSALAKITANFNLHVLLIMRSDGITKSKATIVAYGEGVSGLDARLPK